MSVIAYSIGFSYHHAQVWIHRQWNHGNDTMHEYWWIETIGMDGIE